MQYKFDVNFRNARIIGIADIERPDRSVGFYGGCVIENISLEFADYRFELSSTALDVLESVFALNLSLLEDEVFRDWQSHASSW